MAHLMKAREVAEVIGIHADTLAHWRLRGRGPRFERIGDTRMIRYDPREVGRFLRRTVQWTKSGWVSVAAAGGKT